MSLKIKNNSGTFDLSTGFSIEIEDTSPIYNDRGSQSIAATLPASKNNLRLTTYPNHLDTDVSPNQHPRVSVSDGVYHRNGKMNITQASKAGGILSNIGFDESEIYNLWSDVSFQSLKDLPVYAPDGGVDEILYFMIDLLREKRSHEAFHVFQICVAIPSKKETVNEKEVETFYPEYLNHLYKDDSGFKVDGSVREEVYLINSDPVTTQLPLGYGLTPFLKVSWLIDFIFSYYGYTVTENPFKTHPQLSRLVVLNNAADCVVKGQINYADLLPNCTINEFFQALYCRFGAIYFVDGRTKTVKLRFLKEIVNRPAAQDWTLLKASEPIINYNSPQQLKLSASTSITGPYRWLTAAPAAESLDKFLAPYGYIVSENSSGYLYYMKHSGTYSRRNIYTKVSEGVSSDFFPWDRGANIEYHEINSIDECLPVKTAYPDDDFFCPAYLMGKVHRYTTIESANVEINEDKDNSTPLCFCFSHPYSAYDHPFGSPRCYTPSGKQVVEKGNTFDISLTFVGEHGAFNRFWKGYDAILRHANHTIETKLHLNHNTLLNADFSEPISLSGQRLLPDISRYNLPLRKATPATVQLRTLKLLKPYNLEEEQTVPIQEQLYKWVFSNNKTDAVNNATVWDVMEFKKGLVAEATYVAVLYKDETEDSVSDVEIPFTVPTEVDYESKVVHLIKKINYSFTLYHKVRTISGYTSQGTPIFKDTETKGKSYSIQYNLTVKAALI